MTLEWVHAPARLEPRAVLDSATPREDLGSEPVGPHI